MLADIPLAGAVLSRGDPALSNYLVDGGRIVAVDFEAAEFKPRGWDFLMLWQSFALRFPDRAREMLEALAEGFSAAHRGMLLTDELKLLARHMFAAMAGGAPRAAA